jgi:MoxR-like ATPase
LQRLAGTIMVEESVARYMLSIVQATRDNDSVQLGASPRSSVSFYEACQSRAMVEGRDYVTPDDVRQMAIPVLSHRILVRSRDGNPVESAKARSRVIHEILKQTPVPE